MSKIHLAGIDIGSNAVRLLVKCVNPIDAEERLSKVQLVRVPLRLGEDAFVKGKISKKKCAQMLSLMKAYKELMQIYEVVEYRACATSAMRDASNHESLTEEIYRETGIRIEVIGGREEAELIYSDLVEVLPQSSGDVFLFADVGGGSTELNLVRERQLIESRSFNIGTVRQLSGKVRQEDWEALKLYVSDLKERYTKLRLVGSGGNINKLLRLGAPSERDKVNLLSVESLRKVSSELKQYSVEERMIRFRLKPDRADVIVPASDLFLCISDLIGATEIIVPTKGLSDGIVDSIYQRRQRGE